MTKILLIIFFLTIITILLLYRKKQQILSGQSKQKVVDDILDSITGIVCKGEKDYLGGKTDERNLSQGKVEITAISIDKQSQDYYQNIDAKAKQDEAIELLLKAAKQNELSQHINVHKQNHRRQQKEQTDKQLRNKRQLEKLRGTKIQKKVAKKVAKTGEELDDEKIKKIKVKSSIGKAR